MTKHHRVAIVFDEHARTLLPGLARRWHVWIVDSDENKEAAQAYWEQAEPVDDELASGVTTFTPQARETEDALDAALELVEDHHGDFAHDPPVDEVLLVGLSPAAGVFEVLRDWGYTNLYVGPEGLLGRREHGG